MTDQLQHSICNALLAFCQRIDMQDRAITIAYSGGVDSQVLLHAMMHLKQSGLVNNPIDAVHVNHGLSPNAETWQHFCQQQAESLQCQCHVFKVHLDQGTAQSLEELARNARYAAITQHLPERGVVFTGHHQDDQVETLLLALKRGSGVQGLGAMHCVRSLSAQSKAVLARPLLNISRDDIEQYAQAYKLTWIEDESNQQQRFDRNFIRSQVLPLLKERWPSVNTTITRSAQHCQQSQRLLEQIAEQDLQTCVLESRSLNIIKLNELTVERRNNLLRYFIELHNDKLPSTKQLEQIEQMCVSESNDTLAVIHLGAKSLRRFKNGLYITPQYADLSDWRCEIDLLELKTPIHLSLPDGLGKVGLSLVENLADQSQLSSTEWFIHYPDNCDTVTLKFQHDNPKCLPSYRDQRRPLKKILQELAVPSWERKRTPFIYINNELAAVLPLFICKGYLGKVNQKCLKINWHDLEK